MLFKLSSVDVFNCIVKCCILKLHFNVHSKFDKNPDQIKMAQVLSVHYS